jgi:putative transposase
MRELFPSKDLATLCGLFGFSRQAYYKHDHSVEDNMLEDGIVLEMVGRIRKLLPNSGGRQMYHIMEADLQSSGIKIGRDAFFSLLATQKLLKRKRKRKPITTWSGHWLKKYPNLVIENDAPLKAGRLWVSDITYIRTTKGFVYLALITDAYSRKIVGHCLSKTLKATMCINALKMAIADNTPQPGLIHHSDRGVQYCSKDYVKVLDGSKILISMTQSGSPYDNALAERVNGILKNDMLAEETFSGYIAAEQAVKDAVRLYNTYRPHSSCDMLTPEQAHGREGELKKRWKNYYNPTTGERFIRHDTEHVLYEKTSLFTETGPTLSDQDIPSLVAPQQSQGPLNLITQS